MLHQLLPKTPRNTVKLIHSHIEENNVEGEGNDKKKVEQEISNITDGILELDTVSDGPKIEQV